MNVLLELRKEVFDAFFLKFKENLGDLEDAFGPNNEGHLKLAVKRARVFIEEKYPWARVAEVSVIPLWSIMSFGEKLKWWGFRTFVPTSYKLKIIDKFKAKSLDGVSVSLSDIPPWILPNPFQHPILKCHIKLSDIGGIKCQELIR